MTKSCRSSLLLLLGAVVASAQPAAPTLPSVAHPLTKPDDKPADMTKKVKVFILMGQSNMVGMGELGPDSNKGTLGYLTKTEKRYPWLTDDKGGWRPRADVYYYDARVKKGAPLGAMANNGKTIGPELGFGCVIGQLLDEPVLVLKSCIGNRSLGWDLLPPGSERYVVNGRTYAGYKDTPDSWVEGEPKKTVNWYAGKQYDDDLANAKAALKDLARFYPGYKGQGYEIAGFVWWQGHKDQNPVHAARYEQNLARLIPSLRKDYDAPKAPFVLATIAFEGWKLAEPGLTIAKAQLAIADPKKHPEFADGVRCVEARDLWRPVELSPKSQGYHYNRNAETYYEVGHALGWAMGELLGAGK